MHEPGLVKSLIALRTVLGPMPEAEVYDIGALHGYVAFLAAEVLQPRRVCAVEMNPGAARLARRNAALNTGFAGRVETINAGVSDESASSVTCLYKQFALRIRPGDTEKGRLLSEGYRQAQIDLVTLDDLARSRDLAPKVIKIDVEGSQMAVLQGARASLKSFAPVLLIEADRPRKPNSDGTTMAALCDMLIAEYGYQIAVFDHRTWSGRPRRVSRALLDADDGSLERNQLLVCLPHA